MIDPRLAWFAIGATCSAVVFGWPWHSRFSRYNRMGPPKGSYGPRLGPGIVQRGNGHGGPTTPKPEIVPGFYGPRRTARWFINNPAMFAECGGPCEAGPEYCDCGQVRLVEGSIIPCGTRSISYPDPGPHD